MSFKAAVPNPRAMDQRPVHENIVRGAKNVWDRCFKGLSKLAWYLLSCLNGDRWYSARAGFSRSSLVGCALASSSSSWWASWLVMLASYPPCHCIVIHKRLRCILHRLPLGRVVHVTWAWSVDIVGWWDKVGLFTFSSSSFVPSQSLMAEWDNDILHHSVKELIRQLCD